ncbi:fatty acid desaturase [Povalibacter sp.]|uniref:fatty acid desaturase n=1 Tax=Povalibacter sp. TaxID=1962978 RepID=UPI002F40993C
MTEARDAVKAPFNWPAVFMFAITTLPAVTVFPWYAWKYGFDAFEWTWFVALCFITGIAITGGYHRLWSHRSYEASKPLQIFYMLFGAMSLQNSILVWASMHRVHHRHVDDVDSDPYSIKRGLWFAHMGWMLRDYPAGKANTTNARDLEANPIVMFQQRYYLWLAVGMNLGIPLLLGWWHGDIWGALLLPGLMRLVVSHHVTFFINSLAHYWGRRPYTAENTARDNDVLALFTYGEGYHNYHHIFQWDYRNGVRWWQYDPTKWFIGLCSWLGLAGGLRRVPEFQIQKALVERQIEQARERVIACQDPSMLARLQAQLEHEAAHLAQLIGDWAALQQEKIEATKQKLLDQWNESEAHRRLMAIEESLRLQQRRVRMIGQQAA